MIRGSVSKRGKNWYYRLELARINGERQQYEKVAGTTKDEAIATTNAAICEYETTGDVLALTDISVTGYFNFGYDKYVMVSLKKNTQDNYRIILDKHIFPSIGHYKLTSIRVGILQDLLIEKFEAGYAKQTLSIIKGVLNKAFMMAVFPYHYLNNDPTLYVTIPNMTKKSGKITGIDFNFHSFRHTHATMLLENGAKPKEIQARLGHPRIATTMDTYAHVTIKLKKETADILEQMLSDASF